VASCTGELLGKQSLWGQVSIKLTPEICISKASSNSRLRDLFKSQFWRLKVQDQAVPYDMAIVSV
jgi:hypothetical protein